MFTQLIKKKKKPSVLSSWNIYVLIRPLMFIITENVLPCHSSQIQFEQFINAHTVFISLWDTQEPVLAELFLEGFWSERTFYHTIFIQLNDSLCVWITVNKMILKITFNTPIQFKSHVVQIYIIYSACTVWDCFTLSFQWLTVAMGTQKQQGHFESLFYSVSV